MSFRLELPVPIPPSCAQEAASGAWATHTGHSRYRRRGRFPLQQEAVISAGQHSVCSKPQLARSSHFTAVLSPAQSIQLPAKHTLRSGS